MIVDELTELLARINTVAALSQSTGTSVASVFPDPSAVDIPLPAAWVAYAGKIPTEKVKNGMVPRNVPTKSLYVVMLYLRNDTGQADLLLTQLPITEAVITAIVGGTLPSEPTGFRFAFEGERLHSITPARLVYEQRYSLISVH